MLTYSFLNITAFTGDNELDSVDPQTVDKPETLGPCIALAKHTRQVTIRATCLHEKRHDDLQRYSKYEYAFEVQTAFN